MAMLIPNLNKYKVCFVACLLHAKEEITTQINRQIISIYGYNAMNRQSRAKWCHELHEYVNMLHKEIRSGVPSVVTNEIVQTLKKL